MKYKIKSVIKSRGLITFQKFMSLRSVIVINKWSATTKIVIHHSITEAARIKKIVGAFSTQICSFWVETRNLCLFLPTKEVIAVKPVFYSLNQESKMEGNIANKIFEWSWNGSDERESDVHSNDLLDLYHRYYELQPITILTFWEVICFIWIPVKKEKISMIKKKICQSRLRR